MHFHPVLSKGKLQSPFLCLLNSTKFRLARVEKKWLCENDTNPQFHGEKGSIESKPISQETGLGELRY